MRKQLVSYLCPFLLSLILLHMLIPAAVQAQAPPPAPPGADVAGDADLRNLNQDALEKLRKMSPEKVAALDGMLAEALTLYYDGKFAQALPIFKSISADVETMDLMWWMGTSAMKTGDTRLAVEKFKAMLVLAPNLHRVRLELAAAYFSLGQYADAKRELDRVKKAELPREVRENVDKLLAATEENMKTVFWNLRFAQGIQWDSNVSSGPDQKALSVTGGTLSLQDDQSKVSDWGATQTVSGNILYDFGDKKGFMWNTTGDLYNLAWFKYGKYNYSLFDMTTGPWWVGRQDIVKAPVGMSKQEYGSSPLSTLYHFKPSYEHFFSEGFSLRGQYFLIRENFVDDANSPLNSTTNRYEITPSFYFLGRRHILSASVGYEFVNADVRRFTYTAPYGAVSYYTRFPTKTEFFMKYQYGERDYKDPTPLFLADDRVDRRHSFTAVLSQEFLKRFFASLAYNYIENTSNVDIYSFTKQTVTLSIGCFF